MNKILVLGGFSEIHKLLYKKGYKLTIITESSKIKPYFNEIYEEVFAFKNLKDHKKIVDKVSHIIDNPKSYKTIICMFENLQMLASKIASTTGIPFNLSNDQVSLFGNKYLMREFLRNKRFDTIPFRKVRDTKDLFEFINDYGESIVKPINGTGSKSVYKINLNNVKTISDEISEFKCTPFIIEKFIEGEEFSVESISIDGKHYVYGITKKLKNDDDFVEIGHIVPANISDKVTKNITDYVCELLNILQFKNGPSHTEIIVGYNNEISLVETHARIGGDMISELYRLMSKNYNPLEIAALSLVKDTKSFNGFKFHDKYTAIYFNEFEGKVIENASINDEYIKKHNNIIGAEIFVTPGDKKRETGSENRVGYVIQDGNDYKLLCDSRKSTLNKVFNIDYK
ncbi:ATP-grasp domain-containing protein [Staphylococcus simulans]